MEYWGSKSTINLSEICLTDSYSKIIYQVVYHQKNILLQANKNENHFSTFQEVIQTLNADIENNFLNFHKKITILPIDFNDFNPSDTIENLIEKLKCRLFQFSEHKTDLVLVYKFFDFHINKLKIYKKSLLNENNTLCLYICYIISLYQIHCYDIIQIEDNFWDVKDEFDLLLLFDQVLQSISQNFIIYLFIKNSDTTNFIILKIVLNFISKIKKHSVRLILEYSDLSQYLKYTIKKLDYFYLNFSSPRKESSLEGYQISFIYNFKRYKYFKFDAETEKFLLQIVNKNLKYFTLKDIKLILLELIKINAISYLLKENIWSIKNTNMQKVNNTISEYFKNTVHNQIIQIKQTQPKFYLLIKQFLNLSYFLEWIPVQIICEFLTSSVIERKKLAALIETKFSAQREKMQIGIQGRIFLKTVQIFNDQSYVILFNYSDTMKYKLTELLEEDAIGLFSDFLNWIEKRNQSPYNLFFQNILFNFCFQRNENFHKTPLNIRRYKLKAFKVDKLMLANCSKEMINNNIEDIKYLLSIINNIEFSLDLLKTYQSIGVSNSVIYALMDQIKQSLIAQLQQGFIAFDEKQVMYLNNLIYYAIDTKHFDDVENIKNYIKINQDTNNHNQSLIINKIKVIAKFWDIYLKILFNELSENLLQESEQLIIDALKNPKTLIIGYILKLFLANIALANQKIKIAESLYLSSVKLESLVESEEDQVLKMLKDQTRLNFEKNYNQIA